MAKKTPGSGRTKGTPNKRTLEAREIAERMGFCAIESLIHWARGDWKALGYESGTVTRSAESGETFEVDRISPELRQKSVNDAAKYLYPTLKATEHSINNDVMKTVEDFIRETK